MQQVVLLTPYFNEKRERLRTFTTEVKEVSRELPNYTFTHYLLADGAKETFEDIAPHLINRPNKGIVLTMIEAYKLAQELHPCAIVVKIDTNEHKPAWLPSILRRLTNRYEFAAVGTVLRFKGQPVLTDELANQINRIFANAVLDMPFEEATIQSVYNRLIPYGYQAFSPDLLSDLIPLLERGIMIYEELYQEVPRWGGDLLSILLVARIASQTGERDLVDIFIGGFSEAWIANRSEEKNAEQAMHAHRMITVARTVFQPPTDNPHPSLI
jgi:hypothetical protein